MTSSKATIQKHDGRSSFILMCTSYDMLSAWVREYENSADYPGHPARSVPPHDGTPGSLVSSPSPSKNGETREVWNTCARGGKDQGERMESNSRNLSSYLW
jgi:hypothetical protein